MSSFPLFDKKCEININGKLFTSAAGFSIEFENQQYFGKFTTIVARLYNPNDDTIGRCNKQKINGKTVYPPCSIKAGYVGNFGAAGQGRIKKYTVLKDDKNRILELTIGDTEAWINKLINKTFKNMRASAIIKEITKGNPSNIDLAEDPIIPRLYVRNVYTAIERYLRKKTKSNYAFRNGILVMEPLAKRKEREVLLTYDNGLVETPEAINVPRKGKRPAYSGYKIKTLFLYGLNLFTTVRIKTTSTDPNKKPIDVVGKIEKVNQKFSTFKSTPSEYMVRVA